MKCQSFLVLLLILSMSLKGEIRSILLDNMSILYSKPASLYCAAAEVFSKKPTPTTAVNLNGIGICLRYRCERDSSVEIKKEVYPKECKHDPAANMDLGTTIRGEILDIWIKGIRRLNVEKVGGHTGRHSTNTINSKVDTYASLIQPFVHTENAINKRILAEKKKALNK